MIRSINPATEAILAEYNAHSPEEVERAVDEVAFAQATWRRLSPDDRAAKLRALASLVRARRAECAALITSEMGKPIVEAEAEIEKCAWAAEHYADHGARYLADEPHPTESLESYVSFQPLGVILAVMPWNFPFWQVFRAGMPAVMAGNTIVLKHASNVPQSALMLETLFQEAGLDGCLRTVLMEGGAVERLIEDHRISGVTLTGSTEIGARVASIAASNLKKHVVELGGSDPFIVLADADVERAADVAARARNQNSGQSCIAAKRFMVADEIADNFLDALTAAVSRLRVGAPQDRETHVGPLARADLRETLTQQVDASRRLGARVVVGAGPMDRPGFFYEPTIMDEVTPDMPVFREETFGPVASVVRVKHVDEAIRLANDTPYGLGASIWTQDLEHAKRMASEIEAGSVFVNSLVTSDPRLPIGGVKRSGYGRELGRYGLLEFTNIQTVRVEAAST